ncbi:MAG: hypothetical protein ACXVJD_13185 [Mucilaginibacter sp.]
MSKYNIIYTSPNDDDYLWSDNSFDKIENKDREVLLYSGKSLNEDAVTAALKQAQEAAAKQFADNNPKVKKVEVTVG